MFRLRPSIAVLRMAGPGASLPRRPPIPSDTEHEPTGDLDHEDIHVHHGVPRARIRRDRGGANTGIPEPGGGRNMKSVAFVCTGLLILAVGSASLAQDRPPLGGSHFAVEWDAMLLQHRTFETDDVGFYLGISGYGHIGRNWYLGGEIGGGGGFGTLFLGETSSYMPIELNAKRAFGLTRNLVADLGGGLSYSRVEYNQSFSSDGDVADWVVGAQVMGDGWFRAGRFLAGVKLKYQLTADVEGVDPVLSTGKGWDYSNLKIGVQIGFVGSL